MRSPIIYLVRREGFSSVFASQVARRAASIAAHGFEVGVAVLGTPGQWLRRGLRLRWKGILAQLPRPLQNKVAALPCPPGRVEWPWLESSVLKCWLWMRSVRSTGAIVQGRNTQATYLALRLRDGGLPIRVVFDCRGLVDHELLYDHGFSFANAPPVLRKRALRLGEMQRECALRADSVFCVSSAMVDYLVKDASISREKCEVVPCCVDLELFEQCSQARESIRDELGLSGKLVVGYCGSLVGYQRIEHSLALFRQVLELQPAAHFLAVTTSSEKMRKAAAVAGLNESQYTIRSVRPNEVPGILPAIDVGLLLREKCEVNRVASPVKFAEYLAAGAPVIVSAGIGDYSALVREESVGLTLTDHSDHKLSRAELEPFLRNLEVHRDAIGRRCKDLATRSLGFDVYNPTIASVYRHLGQALTEGGVKC